MKNMKPTPRDFEEFASYNKERLELTKQLVKDPSAGWEVEHRIRILEEWLENKRNEWNTKD